MEREAGDVVRAGEERDSLLVQDGQHLEKLAVRSFVDRVLLRFHVDDRLPPRALQRRRHVVEPWEIVRRRGSRACHQEPNEDADGRIERGPAFLHESQHALERLRVEVQRTEPLAERREAERRARVVLLADDEAQHELVDVGDLVVAVPDGALRSHERRDVARDAQTEPVRLGGDRLHEVRRH